MPTPSWDLAITVFFLIGIAFGYILQRDKIIATMLSVYVGLIITQAAAGNVQNFFQGESTLSSVWVKANASPFTIRAVIFIGVIMLVSAKSGISASKSSKGLLSPLEVIVYSIFTSGLILSSLFYFMPAESREAFVMGSRMAKLVINNYIWWILLPIAFMIVTSFFHKGSSDD
jgi:hypothetical protein